MAESSAGGLISAALVGVPGASAFFVGGAVVYTRAAGRAFVATASVPTPPGLRAETEQAALHLARSVAAGLATTWGIGEGGAAGPSDSPYGDPAGHAWVAVSGPTETTRHVGTGSRDRAANMVAFAAAALTLLAEALDAADGGSVSPLG